MISVTARVKAVFRNRLSKSLKNIVGSLQRGDIHEAERSWIMASQAEVAANIKPETLKRLGAGKENGIIIVVLVPTIISIRFC